MKLGPFARAFVTCGLCACVLVLVMAARAVLEARAELARAEAVVAQGDLDAGITALRRAARWNAPGNYYAEAALERLARLADAADMRGDKARALTAYRAIHAAIHASRGFYESERERLAHADRQIAQLMASEAPAEIDAALTLDERRAHYLSLLTGPSPHPGWVLLSCAGFLTWVVAASMFLLRGVDDRGRVVRRVARRSGMMLLLGWIAFALGLRLA
jgi:hypothetical protein